MLRLVLDSNVLISAFYWEGNERSLLRECRIGKYKLVTSSFILEEVERVLKEKFDEEEHLVRSYIREVFKFSELVVTPGRLNVITEDPSDNNVLETAVVGKANYLITGDKHLLKIGEYNNILILKSADFS